MASLHPANSASPLGRCDQGGAFVLKALQQVESTSTTRAIRFLHAPEGDVGEVVSSDGRVCMVTLLSGVSSLGKRVRAAEPQLAEAIRVQLARAKTDGRPLGDAFAALGTRPTEVVRRTLHDLFVDNLLDMSRMPLLTFEPSPRTATLCLGSNLTRFKALDLYWSAVPSFAPPRDVVSQLFEEQKQHAERAALIAWGAAAGGAPVLLNTTGLALTSMGEVASLGAHIERLLRPPKLVAAGEPPKIISFAVGKDSVVGIASAAHMAMFVGIKPDRRGRIIATASRAFQSAQ